MSLKLTNISKRFGDQWILRDANLEIARGEIFGLLGANGSGKTTLLKLIAGSEKADSGQIYFDSEDLTGVSEKDRRFVFPNNDSQNVWKSLFGSKTSEISAGERQQSAFEDSIQSARSVLLLDNPFCCLSDAQRDAALEDLQTLAREKNLAVVFSTNDYEEAFTVCDRICVLHKGQIVQVGTPRELYEKPINAAVGGIMGRNNFIKARRVTFNNEQTQEFQTIEGNHRLLIGKAEKNALGTITNDVLLAIRPEHISISFGASFPEDNLLRAEIIGVHYRGATTRVKLSANELMLEALVLRLVGLKVGDECMVGLPPDRISVLKD